MSIRLDSMTITPPAQAGEVVPVTLHNVVPGGDLTVTEPYTIRDSVVRVCALRVIRDAESADGLDGAQALLEACTSDGLHICNLPPVAFRIDRSPEAVEATTQAYNALKLLPEYADAADC